MAKRAKAKGEPIPPPLTELDDEESTVLREIYETVGGRTTYLARVARADDMLGAWRATQPHGKQAELDRGGKVHGAIGEGVAAFKVRDQVNT